MVIGIAETKSTCYEVQPDMGVTLAGRRRSQIPHKARKLCLITGCCATLIAVVAASLYNSSHLHQQPQKENAMQCGMPDWS